MGPKQERAVPLMSPADVSAPHASIPPVTEAHHIVALMKENLFPLLDHWLLPNLLSSRAMEDLRRDAWKEIKSPRLILAHLVWSLLAGKYSKESEEYNLALENLLLNKSEARSRTIKERGTGSVQDACITSPAALWAAAYPVYESFPLSHQEMSLLVEEAWHRYTFMDEHWPKSPEEYVDHVSKIERQPHSMLEALGLDKYTYPLFSMTNKFVLMLLWTDDVLAEAHRFNDSVSLLDARLKDASEAKFKDHRELSALTEMILTLMDSVVFQIDARHEMMFFATRTHRLKIVFQLASLPCLQTLERMPPEIKFNALSGLMQAACLPSPFTGRDGGKGGIYKSASDVATSILRRAAQPLMRPDIESRITTYRDWAGFWRSSKSNFGGVKGTEYDLTKVQSQWNSLIQIAIAASRSFTDKERTGTGEQAVHASVIMICKKDAEVQFDAWRQQEQARVRHRQSKERELAPITVKDGQEDKNDKQQSRLKGTKRAQDQGKPAAETAQEQRDRARQQQRDALQKFYECYREPKIVEESDRALQRVASYSPTGSQAQQLQRVRDGIAHLRTRLLDRRGVLTADSERAGDLFVDQLANLLFDPKNIGAVLKACDFEDLTKFQAPVALSYSTPDRSNLETLGDLYNRSESVRVAVEAILNNDDRGSLLFIGGLTLSVPDLKKLRAAQAEEVAGFIERIRRVLRGEERVASVKTKMVARISTGRGELPVLPVGFWDTTGQAAEQWTQTPNESGSMTLTRIEDGVSLTIPKKKLKTLSEAGGHFKKNIETAELQRQLDLILQGLESEGFVVTREEAGTKVKHVGANTLVTIGVEPREGIGKIRRFVNDCAWYRMEIDAMHTRARESGVALTLVTAESGCSAVVCDQEIPINSIHPTREEMASIRAAIEAAGVKQRSDERRLSLLEQLHTDAEELLPTEGIPSIILDATVLIHFSAAIGTTRLLSLLNLLAERGVRMYVPATVFFECTGMVPFLRDGERMRERVLPFALSDEICHLLERAPIVSFADTGSGVKVVGCANFDREMDPKFIIVEGPQDREHFRQVLRQRAAYLRNAKEGGTLADSLRNVGLLGAGAGDRSICEFYRTMMARSEKAGTSPKMIICSDDNGLWSETSSTFGTRDLISYIYADSSAAAIAHLLGNPSQSITELDLVNIIGAGRPNHHRRFLRMYRNLQHRAREGASILKFFEDTPK